jgi:2-oxoglutarate ferredoxin oxidoreductase subunit gamma
MAKHEIIMAGTGGQGLVYVASFIAEAAILAGRNVVQTQSYGIAQRGGFISAEAIMDTEEILFQQVRQPDVVIALSDVVGARYDQVACAVVYDGSLMSERAFPNWLSVPCTRIAHDLGAPKAANLVGLGAAMAVTRALPFEVLREAARAQAKEAAARLNIAALESGLNAAAAAAEKRRAA